MVSAVSICNVKLFCAVIAGVLLSVTRIVKFEKTVPVGVPLIVLPVRVNPAGSEPEKTENVYGAVPLTAAKGWEYALPFIPTGNGEAVVIVKTTTVIVRSFCAVCAGLLLSVTRTVKLDEPVPEGVPLIVAPFRDKPFGNDPEVMDHV